MDAPGAAGDQPDTGDLFAGLEGLLDSGLVRLAGGLDRQPLGIEGLLVVDFDGLGFAGGELVVREAEPGGLRLEESEDQDEGFLQGIGPIRIAAGEIREPLGLLLAIGGLAAQVLDHPAGGVSLGRQGSLIALLSEQGRLQLSEDLGAADVVIGLELLGQLADRGGEFLGLDTQLEEGAGAL